MSARRPARAITWGVLAGALGVSVVLLLWVFGQRRPTAAPGVPVRLQVLDEAGMPLRTGVGFVRRQDGAPSDPGALFDSGAGVLQLPVADFGATVLLGAPGCRVVRIEDVRADRTVVLERGHVVRLRMTGDSPPLDPPLVGLFRIRPTAETAALGEGPGTEPLDLCALMEPLFRSRPEALTLPSGEFGLALSEDDAASGFRIPIAGRYEVAWGMLDEGPGTWFRLEDGPLLEIDVTGAAEPQVFDFVVTRPEWNRTRDGLRERIEQLRPRQAAR